MIALGPFANSRVAGACVVDLVGANEAKGDQRRNAERGRAEEYRALGKIVPGKSHQPCSESVARRIKAIVATGADRHCAPADQTETDARDRREQGLTGAAVTCKGPASAPAQLAAEPIAVSAQCTPHEKGEACRWLASP